MCTLLFAHRADPEYPLVIAANRDEHYGRATERADYWRDAPEVLGGRDGVAGGTWMALRRDGRWAALTNVREPGRVLERAPSRGDLVRDFLVGDVASPAAYLESVAARAQEYNGFNLVVGEAGGELWYLSNRDESSPARLQRIAPGIYGVSNALLDTPWPKVTRGREALDQELTRARAESRAPDADALLELLHDPRQAPDEQLPSTGVSHELERLLSPLFIATERYGTCSSTALVVDRLGRARFVERTTNPRVSPSGSDADFTLQLTRRAR